MKRHLFLNVPDHTNSLSKCAHTVCMVWYGQLIVMEKKQLGKVDHSV